MGMMSELGWLEKGALAFAMNLMRYLLIAGGFYSFFYILFKNRWLHRRIQSRFPERRHLLQEVQYSVISIFIFAVVGVSTFALRNHFGWTRIYSDIDEYGWWYLVISVPLMLLLHDTYFYWTHRMMHLPKLYPYFHKVHHLSHNPSPWAAFSFHPLEAVVEAGIFPVIVFILPVHPVAIFVFLTSSMIMNVLGHLGYEIFPRNYLKTRWGKWNNTSTHHNMHHRYVRCNYSLYFNFWDRVMKTNHEHYETTYEQVTSKSS